MDIMDLRTLSSLLVLAFLVQFGSGQQQQQHPPPGPLASRTPTLAIVPDALLETTCTGTDPCVTDCTDCSPNEKVPNPEDCRTYYMCIDGTPDNYYPLPFDCGDGQVYNFTEHDCVTGDTCEPCGPAPLECSYECPAATTESPTGAATTADDPVYIPHSYTCNNYYKCDAGEISESLTCGSEAPFFDGEECQTDETRCCHCHPFCYSEEEEVPRAIPDPLDCRGYYFCTADDVGSTPTTHGTCPDGEYFDSYIQDCSATALCVTQCTNVVGIDGCIDPFTCLEEGYFAKCPLAEECTPEYYHCTGPTGLYQEAGSCSNGQVYNPNTHNCVSVDNCP